MCANRFAGVLILQYIDPAFLLAIYAFMCSLASIMVSQLDGWAGVGFLYVLFWFESICYPVSFNLDPPQRFCSCREQCIFTLGTKNLGRYTKKGSGLIVMGVGGGAWYPPAQGGLADLAGTRRSYLVPMSGYLAMFVYAV